MKKLFILLLVTLSLFLFNSRDSFGQARLHIERIDSFPVFPGDTAYEGRAYNNIRVVVKNIGNSGFFGDIHVYLRSQSVGVIDTLFDGPHPPFLLAPGVSDTLYGNPNYRFKTIHYAAGDNIIVVWPFSPSTNFDFHNTEVYYVPLATGVEESNPVSLNIYPNPVSQIIHLRYAYEKGVDRVRIYDLAGREVFNVNEAVKAINASRFGEGIYFLELIQKDGQKSVKKIIINGK